MSLKLRLIVMNFLQFFVWGAWLLTIGAYWFQNKQWSGTGFGAIFSTMGIASLFMPALMGVVADKWINAEKLYGLLHIGGAVMLFLRADGRRPAHHVLGDAAEHDLLHADDRAGDHGGLQRAQARRPGRGPRLPADPGVGHDRLHRRAVDHQPAAPGNLVRPVLRGLGGIAAAGPVCLHPAAGAAAAWAAARAVRWSTCSG